MSEGLRGVTTQELRTALGRCAGVEQVDADRIRGWGAPALAETVGRLGVISRDVLVAILECALAEREAPKAQVDLVWTGPHPRTSTARDTYVVMRDLFKSAKSEVIVAGYRFDHGEELLRPLYERALQGVGVFLFLDVVGKVQSDELVDGFAAQAGRRFIEENWPFGEPVPQLYFDPRSVAPGRFSSMHAKCIVVDRRVALVGSANFTSRARTENIELGVVVDDPRFATELAGHWWSGVQSGVFRGIAGVAGPEIGGS